MFDEMRNFHLKTAKSGQRIILFVVFFLRKKSYLITTKGSDFFLSFLWFFLLSSFLWSLFFFRCFGPSNNVNNAIEGGYSGQSSCKNINSQCPKIFRYDSTNLANIFIIATYTLFNHHVSVTESKWIAFFLFF